MNKDEKILSIAELHKQFESATKTDEPVAIETPSGNHINGTTSLVGSVTPKDYVLEFYLPVLDGKYPSEAELVMGGTAYRQLIKANQKFITARVARKVRSYASKVALAFTDFKERGDSSIYSPEELMKFYQLFDDEVIKACEGLIVTTLGIDESLMEYITDVSLINTCAELINNNKSFFQED